MSANESDGQSNCVQGATAVKPVAPGRVARKVVPMGKVLAFKPYEHQCYRRIRKWGGGVVKDAICPLCVEHKRKLELYLRASRLRGRIRRRGVVKE